MNLEHKEKQEVFDSYAKEQGYKNWIEILLAFKSYEFSISVFNKHIFNATDLIQRKALERASSKAKIGIVKCDDCNCEKEFYCRENRGILKESITNENNLIK